MEDRFSQQIKKGVLGLLVRKLVCDRDRYGYALQKSLAEVSQGESGRPPRRYTPPQIWAGRKTAAVSRPGAGFAKL